MTPEQQRIAIAEACGWKGISPEYLTGYAPWRQSPYSQRVMGDLDSLPLDPLPDYLNDLNAMHEAEQVLINSSRYHIYCNWLDQLVGSRHHPHKACSKSATAAQRAEAFLRTLNLWTP